MSTLTAAQRGDLAEEMLPVAAHLAVLVHGDGGPEDVAQVLEGLSEAQKNALLVVLAGLVDPDQPVGKALGWLDFNEHGNLTVPSWSEQRSVRDLVPEPELEDDERYVDEVAVQQHLRGKNPHVTPRERLEAVARGVRMGMTYPDFDTMYRLRKGSTSTFVSRMRKRLIARGEPVPSMERPGVREFTEQDVIRIRERSAAGASDTEIAMSFDCTRETIRSICRGERYTQWGGPIRQVRSKKGLKASREYMCGHADNSLAAQPNGWQKPVLTPQDRDAIHQRTKNGENFKELAAEYGVSIQTIYDHAA